MLVCEGSKAGTGKTENPGGFGGDFGVNPQNLPPKTNHPDKKVWLQENLPLVAGVVDRFASAFGRSNLTVVYASENGHVIGKPGSDGVKLSETVVGRLFPDGSAGKAR